MNSKYQQKILLDMPILLDGGFGRELERNGISIQAPLWSANAFYDSPQTIKKIHKDFINAGSDIISTNTYALTEYTLSKAGKLKDYEKLLNKAYSLANEAIKESDSENTLIAASIPPLTESYNHEMVEEDKLNQEYSKLINIAVQNKSDLILAETLTTIAEAKSVLSIANSFKIPIWISFSVNEDGNLRSGESLEKATNIALDLEADGVLVNCSHSDDITKSTLIFEHLNKTRQFIYGAYANRFTPVREGFKLSEGLNTLDDQITSPSYSNYVKKWLEHGAKVVGGCCGIGCDFIQDIKDNVLDNNQKS